MHPPHSYPTLQAQGPNHPPTPPLPPLKSHPSSSSSTSDPPLANKKAGAGVVEGNGRAVSHLGEA